MLSTREEKVAVEDDPIEVWPHVHRSLGKLLRQGGSNGAFVDQIEKIRYKTQDLLDRFPDESLFVLVQMLSDEHFGYSTTHALLSAVTCQLVAPSAGLSKNETETLIKAAMTMNMGMSELHDKLAHQLRAVDDQQRQQINDHPKQSVDLLSRSGVADSVWLQLVRDHHETTDGLGYPAGKTELTPMQKILHMSDVFVANISPRGTRRGLPPRLAVGNLYLANQEPSCPLGAILAKQLGMYPPGTFVRLRSTETAVVVRRGTRVNTPLTMAVADGAGFPVLMPTKRDTQMPSYTVLNSVAPEDVKIRLDVARLFKRI